MEQWMWAVWLGVLLLAIVIEIMTEELVAVWFIGGSVAAIIMSVIAMETIPWWAELIVFAAVSLILLATVRPLAKKYLTRDQIDSNADTLVGRKGVMSKEATDLEYGEVKINGVIWTAIVPNGMNRIETGTKVEVLAIEGNKLIVKPLAVEEKQ